MGHDSASGGVHCVDAEGGSDTQGSKEVVSVSGY